VSLLPLPKGIGDIDVKATIDKFLAVLTAMNAKLDTLIELQSTAVADDDPAAQAPPFCSDCEQIGRLRCPTHGPKPVPALGETR
jgi:hypothetical protein